MLEAGLKGCALGDRGGCYTAGLYYEKYSTEPNRISLAVKYIKSACDDGEPAACVRLKDPDLGSAGPAAAGDLVQANLKLCNSGNGSACNTLGMSYYMGELVPQDRETGLRLMKTGCKFGNKTACANVTKIEVPAERKAAELAALNDPERKVRTELIKEDLACLKKGPLETHEYESMENGSECIGWAIQRSPESAGVCDKYNTITVTKTSTTQRMENVCKRPISFQRYCGGFPLRVTLLLNEVFINKEEGCVLAY
jgi:hypothetical protein